MSRILFVCTGNTCRSPMAAAWAEAWLRSRGVEGVSVESAGVGACEGQPASPEACLVMAEKGLDLRPHRARRLREELLAEADLVLTMTAAQRESLRRLWPQYAGRIFSLKEYAAGEEQLDSYDVADPIGKGEEEYRRCAEELRRGVEAALARYLREIGGSAGNR
ncbi:MAG: low molecular weight protein arginine phosphatase [Moorellales bacterium]